MAGWTCPDREFIEWDGTIRATTGFEGDGSRLTGVAPGTGEANLWASNAIFIYPKVGSQIVSGAGLTTAGTVSGANIFLLTDNAEETSAAYIIHQADTTIHFTSNAIWTQVNLNESNSEETSAALILTSANSEETSAAYLAHATDSSDPHGVTLTQTRLVATSGSVTGDITTSGAAYIPNVIFATGVPSAASNYPIGTIHIQYTP